MSKGPVTDGGFLLFILRQQPRDMEMELRRAFRLGRARSPENTNRGALREMITLAAEVWTAGDERTIDEIVARETRLARRHATMLALRHVMRLGAEVEGLDGEHAQGMRAACEEIGARILAENPDIREELRLRMMECYS
jgi:hypothetical protein